MVKRRIAVVLPPGCSFDVQRPNSIETVVRTHLQTSSYARGACIFCDYGKNIGGEPDVGELDAEVLDAGNMGAGAAEIFRLPACGSRRARTAALVRALRAWRPDLIEYHQHMISAAACARALAPVPTMLYRHNFVKAPGNALHRWNYRRRLEAFSKLVFVSNATRADFIKNWPDFEARTASVPNSVNSALWKGDPAIKERLVSYVGRAEANKGLKEFCQGLRPALLAHPEWRALVIVGAWERGDPCVDMALLTLRDLGGRVTVLANQPHAAVRAQMERVAIAVVPSLCREAFGLTAIEAHAAGAAVISSGRGGLREASGDAALYLERIDGAAIATALKRLIADRELRLRLAVAGQTRVRRRFEAADGARRLDALRAAVLRSAPSPAGEPESREPFGGLAVFGNQR